MALHTLGTNASNSLTAIQWFPGMPQADWAAFDALVKSSRAGSSSNPIPVAAPFRLDQSGHLWLPGRDAAIQLIPGDYLALDSTTGWVIVLSQNAVTNGPYTFT